MSITAIQNISFKLILVEQILKQQDLSGDYHIKLYAIFILPYASTSG